MSEKGRKKLKKMYGLKYVIGSKRANLKNTKKRKRYVTSAEIKKREIEKLMQDGITLVNIPRGKKIPLEEYIIVDEPA